jgi:hypothetical protein
MVLHIQQLFTEHVDLLEVDKGRQTRHRDLAWVLMGESNVAKN